MNVSVYSSVEESCVSLPHFLSFYLSLSLCLSSFSFQSLHQTLVSCPLLMVSVWSSWWSVRWPSASSRSQSRWPAKQNPSTSTHIYLPTPTTTNSNCSKSSSSSWGISSSSSSWASSVRCIGSSSVHTSCIPSFSFPFTKQLFRSETSSLKVRLISTLARLSLSLPLALWQKSYPPSFLPSIRSYVRSFFSSFVRSLIRPSVRQSVLPSLDSTFCWSMAKRKPLPK